MCYFRLVWFLQLSHVLRINSLLKRAFEFCYVRYILTIMQSSWKTDDTLFNKAIASNHTMHHLLLTPKSTCYTLRSVGHGLSVDLVKSELYKIFISCTVFKGCNQITSTVLLNATLSSLHCCDFGFLPRVHGSYCIFIHAFVMMHFTNIINCHTVQSPPSCVFCFLSFVFIVFIVCSFMRLS